MIIIPDTTGITIKRRIGDADHVRVGILQTALWIDGVRRFIRNNKKPSVELTINECRDLMEELEHQKRMVAA